MLPIEAGSRPGVPVLPPQRPSTAEVAPRPSGQQVLPIEAGSRPGTPVLPLQRPSHRRSRSAARQTAGISNRSRQPTGAPRPAAAAAPSPPKPLRGQVDCRCFQQKQAADQGLPSPVPRGKVQEGVPPSWFPAQAGKNLNHFSRRHVRRETFFSRSEVSEVRHPSAVLCHRLSARRALRRGTLAD